MLFDHSKLLIITELAQEKGSISFTELLERTQLTNGNLSSHLRKLEDTKLIKVTKEIVGRRPLTTITLTTQGRSELQNYLTHIGSIIKRVGKTNNR